MITSTEGLNSSELRSLGKQIAQFRKAMGFSQAALAEIVYGNRSQHSRISIIESGKTYASDQELASITAALNGGKAPSGIASGSEDEGAMTIGVAIDSSIDSLMALSEDDRAIAIAAILRKIGMGPTDLFRVDRLGQEERPAINITADRPTPVKQLSAGMTTTSSKKRRPAMDAVKRGAVNRLIVAMERLRGPEDRSGGLPRRKVASKLNVGLTTLASALRGSSSVKTIEALAKRVEAI